LYYKANTTHFVDFIYPTASFLDIMQSAK